MRPRQHVWTALPLGLLASALAACGAPPDDWFARRQAMRASHREAIDRIERAGGRVEHLNVGTSVTLLSAERRPTRDALAAVANLMDLHALTLLDATEASGQLARTGDLPSPRFLVLRGVALTDRDLAHLQRQAGLREIHLIGTAMEGARLLGFVEAAQPTRLALVSQPVPDELLAGLVDAAPGLRWLRLRGTQVTEEAVEALLERRPRLTVELDGRRLRGRAALR